jgi:hypothetical protein
MANQNYLLNIVVSLILILTWPLPVFATEYACTIKSVLELNDVGQYIAHGWGANYMNRKFFVNRETGKVTGTTVLKARLVNFDKTHSPQVLHHGDNENAFKSITIFEDKEQFSVLQINENIKNNEKSYYYQTAIGMLLTGTCAGGR